MSLDPEIDKLGYYDLPHGQSGQLASLLARWYTQTPTKSHKPGQAPSYRDYTHIGQRVGSKHSILENVALIPLLRDKVAPIEERVKTLQRIRGHMLNEDVLPNLVALFQLDDPAAALAELRAARHADHAAWKASLEQVMQTTESAMEFVQALTLHRHLPRSSRLMDAIHREDGYHSSVTAASFNNQSRTHLMSGNIPPVLADSIRTRVPDALQPAWSALVEKLRSGAIAAGAEPTDENFAPKRRAAEVSEEVRAEKEREAVQKEFWNRFDAIALRLQLNPTAILYRAGKMGAIDPDIPFDESRLKPLSFEEKLQYQRPAWPEPALFETALATLRYAGGRIAGGQLWRAPVVVQHEKSGAKPKTYAGQDAALQALYAQGTPPESAPDEPAKPATKTR